MIRALVLAALLLAAGCGGSEQQICGATDPACHECSCAAAAGWFKVWVPPAAMAAEVLADEVCSLQVGMDCACACTPPLDYGAASSVK